MALRLRQSSASRVRVISTIIAAFALVIQPMYAAVDARVASAAAYVFAIEGKGSYATFNEVLSNIENDDTVTMLANYESSEQMTLTQDNVTLDGAGYTIDGVFRKPSATANGNNSVIGIQADNVTVKNISVTSSLDEPYPHQLHGINAYKANEVTLSNVTAYAFEGSGIVVNGSTVNAFNVSTHTNGWHGINVASDGLLNISGTSLHDENSPNPITDFEDGVSVPDIFIDNTTEGSVVNDMNNQYDHGEVAFRGAEARVYTLKDAINPEVSITPSVGSVVSGGAKIKATIKEDNLLRYFVEIKSRESGDMTWGKTLLKDTNEDGIEFVDKELFKIPHDFDGEISVTLHARDTSDNVTRINSHLVVVDNNDPELTIDNEPVLIGGPAGHVFEFSGTASDENGIRHNNLGTLSGDPHVKLTFYKLDDSGNNAEVVGVTENALVASEDQWSYAIDTRNDERFETNGKYRAVVKVYDNAGSSYGEANKSEIVVNFVIDNAAPVVGIHGIVDGGTYRGDVDVMATIEDEHLSHYYLLIKTRSEGETKWTEELYKKTITSDEFNTKKTLFTIPSSVHGEVIVRLEAIDKLGNKSKTDSVKTVQFMLDNRAPLVGFTGYDVDTAMLSGTSDNDEVFVTVRDINGEDLYTDLGVVVMNGVWSQVVDVPFSPGIYTVIVKAIDAAGNLSTTTVDGVNETFIVPVVVTAGGEISVNRPTPIENPISAFRSSFAVTPVLIQPTAETETDVLGAQDEKAQTSPIATVAAIEPSAQGWKFFGFAWFWWLLAAAVITAIWWWIAAARRRSQEA